ncbi:Gamma thionin [Cynara cardunculus var. scolymus]|uniref:Gamma thionin n=1 Tax=Cynara cardunculus var. scolymus TaxID=59895 RepID=A0A103XV40_CYNCS|nr:Gamma thionin [Cynara cardunculus var. scolymus]
MDCRLRQRLWTISLILCFVVIAYGIVTVFVSAEMRKAIGEEIDASCIYSSKTYKGPCFSSSNCRIICKAEGAVSGHCRIFSFRCVCDNCSYFVMDP